ncbi:MAG TPA: LacI family DNA-binding transcriptional regulator [Thermomicrobiales bacterium]|nr:LacI family DNA-binding transcriptional regulator [Thermomicrobiales bacterium]
MPRPRRRPTQLDVARAAGVSQAVVSYVLNDNQTVSILPETRQRVHAAIAELGYVPNTAARSLRSRRTQTLAAIIPDITNPYYPAFVRGIQDVARAGGYDVLAINTDGDREIERSSLDAAWRGRVDGLIITPFFLKVDDLMPLLQDGIPITLHTELADADLRPGIPLDSVSISGETAARTVVNYLIERGHTRIGMIAGQLATPPREGRVRGYRQALAAHHMPLEEVLIREGDFSEAGGYESMRELLMLSPRPTAVFAANDLMAMGALLACREQGVDVPGEIALAGFDDIPAARLVHPALTTIDQHAHESGRRCAELLLSRLDGSYTGPVRREMLGFRLVPRASA